MTSKQEKGLQGEKQLRAGKNEAETGQHQPSSRGGALRKKVESEEEESRFLLGSRKTSSTGETFLSRHLCKTSGA